ncbi:MAG: hypothetical protein HQL58_03140 [Magnetococcales bacterium]|nr:hypothetical protein [Magnetococcales bacterium]
MNPAIEQTIRSHLIRSRNLAAKQASVICTHLDGDDPLEKLADVSFGALEEYEIEWMLAGLFTPSDQDRVIFEPWLPVAGLTATQLDDLIDAVSSHSPFCTLTFDQRRITLLIPSILINRYVRLLHLDHPLDDAIASQLHEIADHPYPIASLARQDVWQSPPQHQLLRQIVSTLCNRSSRIDGDLFSFLTEMVYSGRPHSVATLLTQLRNLLESYRLEQEHPVYNPRLEEYQGNSVRSSLCGEQVKARRLAMTHSWIELLIDP